MDEQDIVKRLRDTEYEMDVCWEAATEIERLRRELRVAEKWRDNYKLAWEKTVTKNREEPKMSDDLIAEINRLRATVNQLETKLGWYKAVNTQLQSDLANQHEDKFLTYFRQALERHSDDQ